MSRREAPLSGALFKSFNIHDLFLHSITSQLTTMNPATLDECTCKSVFFLLACSVLTFILNSLWSFFLSLFQLRRVTVVVSVFYEITFQIAAHHKRLLILILQVSSNLFLILSINIFCRGSYYKINFFKIILYL